MKTNYKKTVYITSFTVLGLLLGFIVHALVEIIYIKLLLYDFETFGIGLSFNTWFVIHEFWAVVTLLVGLWAGFRLGKYWWEQIYVLKKYKRLL